MNQFPHQTISSAKTIYTTILVLSYLLAAALLVGAIVVTEESDYIPIGLYVASAVWFIVASGFAIKRYQMRSTVPVNGLQQQQPYMVNQQYTMPDYSNPNQPSAFKQGPQAHVYPVQPPPGQVPTQFQQHYSPGNMTYQPPPPVNMGYQDTRVFEQTLR